MAAIVIRRTIHKWVKDKLNYSKFPKLDPRHVEESAAKGSGPGGQSVNTSSNAVRLKHLPTGVSVRCHDTRSLEKNKKIAWKKLAEAVDVEINGEESVQAQIKRLSSERHKWVKEQRAKKREEKARLKEEAERSDEETEDVEEEKPKGDQ